MRRKWSTVWFLTLLVWLALPLSCWAMHPMAHVWTSDEKETLRSMWINSLPPPPDDPSNRYDTDPSAVRLGKKLFEDTRLSANGKVACSTCHIPDKSFTDNLPVSHGMEDTTRRSMPLAGMAYSPWLFWDGRADSLWAQALGPLESPEEHGISRTRCAQVVVQHYRAEYESVFGPLPPRFAENFSPLARPAPDNPEIQALWISLPPAKRAEISRLYANVGKAIAAFVRTIMPGISPFDRYVEALLRDDRQAMEKIMEPDAAVGLKLFIGKAQCTNCHNGPLLTNNDFHNVGVPQPKGFAPDNGRADAIIKVLASEFNCMSSHSDANPEDCQELRFIDTDTVKYSGAFKTPSLRNVADRPPYMHAGQHKTLHEVLKFYQQEAKKRVVTGFGRPDIAHGQITDDEVLLLEAFLKTLSGPIVAAQ